MFTGPKVGPVSMTTGTTTQTTTKTTAKTTAQTTTQTTTPKPALASTPLSDALVARAKARNKHWHDARKAMEVPKCPWQGAIINVKSQTAPTLFMKTRVGGATAMRAPAASSSALAGMARQNITPDPAGEALHAPVLRVRERGERKFGFGTGASVQPGKPIEKMSEIDQLLQEIKYGGAPVHDLSDVEALLAKLETPDAAAPGTRAPEGNSAQVSLGSQELASGKLRVQQTSLPTDNSAQVSLGPQELASGKSRVQQTSLPTDAGPIPPAKDK